MNPGMLCTDHHHHHHQGIISADVPLLPPHPPQQQQPSPVFFSPLSPTDDALLNDDNSSSDSLYFQRSSDASHSPAFRPPSAAHSPRGGPVVHLHPTATSSSSASPSPLDYGQGSQRQQHAYLSHDRSMAAASFPGTPELGSAVARSIGTHHLTPPATGTTIGAALSPSRVYSRRQPPADLEAGRHGNAHLPLLRHDNDARLVHEAAIARSRDRRIVEEVTSSQRQSVAATIDVSTSSGPSDNDREAVSGLR